MYLTKMDQPGVSVELIKSDDIPYFSIKSYVVGIY